MTPEQDKRWQLLVADCKAEQLKSINVGSQTMRDVILAIDSDRQALRAAVESEREAGEKRQAEAVAKEREACVQIGFDAVASFQRSIGRNSGIGEWIAELIRARA